MRRSLWSGGVTIWLCGGALLCARPIAAQPEAAGRGFQKDAPTPTELKQQSIDLRGRAARLRKTDPQQAVSLLDGFLRAHPDLSLSDAAFLIALKAKTQQEQNRDAEALQTYRTARAAFSSESQPQKAWAEAGLLTGEARLLLEGKDARGAASLLEEYWPLIARSNANRDAYAWSRTREAVETYVKALDASGHKKKVPDVLAGHLLQSPELLEFAGGANDLGALLVTTISDRLTKAKRGEEVASWARLRYATCGYGVEPLDGATLFLGRTWSDTTKARQFGAAQSDALAPNPLEEVAWPALMSSPLGRSYLDQRAREMEEALAESGDAELVPDLVGLHLVRGEMGAAMAWAWSAAQVNPRDAASVSQVCRVFKANDLDLVRAQEFLDFTAGKGENPVPAFLAEHEGEAAVQVSQLKAKREPKEREKAARAAEWQAVSEAPRGVKLGLVNLGALTPGAAREAGALKIEDTMRLIGEQRVRGWMSVPEREMIRLALGEVLEQQLAQLPPKEQPDVPPLVQLALADSKRKRGDAGAVPLYEALIVAAEKRNEKGFDKQSIVPLAHLAMFYSETGQHLKAAETWSRWKDVPTSDEWNADWRIPAAGAYTEAGQPEVAQRLYDEVPQYGYGWYPAIALWVQALPLIKKGELTQAYALMNRPLKLTADITSGVFAQNAWLAHIAYRQGDFKKATQHAEVALDSGTKLSAGWARDLYQRTKDIHTKASGWKNQPIQTDTKEVVFQANPSQPDKPLIARFRIKTYGDPSITASVDNPNIQARVLPVNNWQREGHNAREEEMEVIVQSNSLKLYNDVPLVLSSKRHGSKATVRISLVEKPA